MKKVQVLKNAKSRKAKPISVLAVRRTATDAILADLPKSAFELPISRKLAITVGDIKNSWIVDFFNGKQFTVQLRADKKGFEVWKRWVVNTANWDLVDEQCESISQAVHNMRKGKYRLYCRDDWD